MVVAKSKTAVDKGKETKKKSGVKRGVTQNKDKATSATSTKDPRPRPPRIRKPKPQPILPQPLTSLPAEVLNLVIQYIIPPQICFINPPLHPSATPYPPVNRNVTSRLKARSERWGTIPEGLIDIINLSRCCRQTRDACGRYLQSIGGSVKDSTVKEEVLDPGEARSRAHGPPGAPANLSQVVDRQDDLGSATVTRSVVRSRPNVEGCKQLYLRLSHSSKTGDNLTALMLEARDTLEHVVFFNCGSDHGSSYRTEERSESPMNCTVPLQYGRGNNYIALPNLKSVQVGPNVCGQCSQACLRLIASRNYVQHLPRDGYGKSSWVLTKQTLGWPMAEWARHQFDHVAAPKLEAIQQFLPVPVNRGRHADSRMLESYHPMLDKELMETLKSLSIVLPNLDRRWGGFGVSGFSSNVHQKTKEQVEQDLAERSRIHLINPGPAASRRRTQETKHIDKVKEKWAALAKTALVRPTKPTATLGDEAARAAAVALVSSIKPVSSGSKDKGKGKVIAHAEESSNHTVECVRGTRAGSQGGDGGAEDKSMETVVGLASGEKEGSGEDKGKGKAIEEVEMTADGARADTDDSLETPLSPVPLKPDLDDSGSPSSKRRHSSSSSSDGETAGQAAGSSTQAGPARPRRRPQEEDANGPILSEYDRQAITNRVRLHENFPRLLRDIVEAFPNLVSLQVLRQSARIDIVEDLMTPDEYAAIFVDPLRPLAKLEHLDLGLAVVGRRELRDFPLNLTIPDIESGMNPIVARDLAIRKKLLEADVARATREGDAWRKRVLHRFVLGRPQDQPMDDSTDVTQENTFGPPQNLAAVTDSDADMPFSGWPRTIRSGFIYMADLSPRLMHRGVLVDWEKGVKDQAETLVLTKSKIIL